MEVNASAFYLIHLLDRAVELISRYVPISVSDLRTATANQAEKWVAALLSMIAGALGSFMAVFASALAVFFILFFLLRDGKSMLRRAAVLLPLRADQTRRLFARVREALYATVYGMLAIAGIQGTLTGIAFWGLGITSPVLWAIITALCALLPVIGTSLILVPAISMLIFSGYWIKGLYSPCLGAGNRPSDRQFIAPTTDRKSHQTFDTISFFALLGGLKAFGALGLFIGPVILAIVLALFQFLREEKRTDNWRRSGEIAQTARQ